jgi:hypothetical protein
MRMWQTRPCYAILVTKRLGGMQLAPSITAVQRSGKQCRGSRQLALGVVGSKRSMSGSGWRVLTGGPRGSAMRGGGHGGLSGAHCREAGQNRAGGRRRPGCRSGRVAMGRVGLTDPFQ